MKTERFSGSLRPSHSGKCLIGPTTSKTPLSNSHRHQTYLNMISPKLKLQLRPTQRWCPPSRMTANQTWPSKMRYSASSKNPQNCAKSHNLPAPLKSTRWKPTSSLFRTKLKIFRTSFIKLMTFKTLRLVYGQVGCRPGPQIRRMRFLKWKRFRSLEWWRIIDSLRIWKSLKSISIWSKKKKGVKSWKWVRKRLSPWGSGIKWWEVKSQCLNRWWVNGRSRLAKAGWRSKLFQMHLKSLRGFLRQSTLNE